MSTINGALKSECVRVTAPPAVKELNGPHKNLHIEHLNFRIELECDKLMIVKQNFRFYTIINFISLHLVWPFHTYGSRALGFLETHENDVEAFFSGRDGRKYDNFWSFATSAWKIVFQSEPNGWKKRNVKFVKRNQQSVWLYAEKLNKISRRNNWFLIFDCSSCGHLRYQTQGWSPSLS